MPASPAVGRAKRPFGVTAIVILELASAVVQLGTGALVLRATVAGSTDLLEQLPEPRLVVLGQLGLVVVQGLADLVAAIGLLRMWRWAWVLVMLLVGYSMAVNLWQYFSGGSPPYLGMAIDVAIVFYLNQREVQRAFGHNDRNRLLDVPIQRVM
jgi:hypothetical protein